MGRITFTHALIAARVRLKTIANIQSNAYQKTPSSTY
jgi:hypothetical protein